MSLIFIKSLKTKEQSGFELSDFKAITKISSKQLREFEEQKELIDELKKQIEQLKKGNYNLKFLLLCNLPPYLNAIIECL